MDIMDLEHDYFLVRFSEWEDVKRVFDDGPWLILGHYQVIQGGH